MGNAVANGRAPNTENILQKEGGAQCPAAVGRGAGTPGWKGSQWVQAMLQSGERKKAVSLLRTARARHQTKVVVGRWGRLFGGQEDGKLMNNTLRTEGLWNPPLRVSPTLSDFLPPASPGAGVSPIPPWTASPWGSSFSLQASSPRLKLHVSSQVRPWRWGGFVHGPPAGSYPPHLSRWGAGALVS